MNTPHYMFFCFIPRLQADIHAAQSTTAQNMNARQWIVFSVSSRSFVGGAKNTNKNKTSMHQKMLPTAVHSSHIDINALV